MNLNSFIAMRQEIFLLTILLLLIVGEIFINKNKKESLVHFALFLFGIHTIIGFFAIDPVRGAGIQFTPPYVNIEGAYLVRQDSKLKANEEVDQAGHRIAVGNGSAYDLYLTREIKRAQLVKAATSQAVVDTFVGQNLEIAAGVRQQLESDAKRLGGLRLLPGRFMVIHQAMGMGKGRSQAAHDYLSAYVEEMKASGFVANALKRHGIEGAAVAPAGRPA